MPKIVDATEQRGSIRRAATRVFSRRGVAGTGLAHVAREAGMGRSTIYHYYRDKTALTRDMVRELLSEEEALFAAAAGTALTTPEGILAEATRMLADPKASSLVTSFAMKWLNLTTLDQVVPDPVGRHRDPKRLLELARESPLRRDGRAPPGGCGLEREGLR